LTARLVVGVILVSTCGTPPAPPVSLAGCGSTATVVRTERVRRRRGDRLVRSGRLWYSVHGPNTAAGTASLGIALPDLSAIVRLPPLPGAPTDRLANDGIVIDPTTGDIWIAEYFRHRLGRLRRI
jgi:hypothetical protein